MPEPDPEPRLRVIDESDRSSEEVVRLSSDAEGTSQEFVARLELPRAPEKAERIEGLTRDIHEGRTLEPTVEAILSGPERQFQVEGAWGDDEKSRTSAPYGWFVVIALLVGGAIYMGFRSTREGEVKVQQVEKAADEKIQDEHSREVEAAQLVDRIQEQVRGYVAAKTIDEMIPYVRQPERVRPLMEDWYRRHPLQPGTFKEMGSFAGVSYRQLPFWRVQTILTEGPGRELLLEQTSDTSAKVDWETDVCYQPMDWADFLKDRPVDKPLDFRVMLRPDTFYTHEYSDDTKWISYRVAPVGGEPLYAYAPVGSEITHIFAFLCAATPGGQAPVVLRLRIPSGSQSTRTALIETLIAPNWIVMGDEPPVSASRMVPGQ